MRTAGVKMKDIPDMLGQQISLGVGRQYTPLSAVRGSIEIGRYAYQHGGVYPLSVTADYMLNLTNMIGNYSENRIFDPTPLPVSSIRTTKWKTRITSASRAVCNRASS